jgi:hypothetical protein
MLAMLVYHSEMADQEIEKVKNHLTQIGKIGGNVTIKRYGKKHLSDLGKKGAAKRWGKYREIKKLMVDKTT